MRYLQGFLLAAAAASAELSRTPNIQSLATGLQEVNSTLTDAINVVDSISIHHKLRSDAVSVRAKISTCCSHDIGDNLADIKRITLHHDRMSYQSSPPSQLPPMPSPYRLQEVWLPLPPTSSNLSAPSCPTSVAPLHISTRLSSHSSRSLPHRLPLYSPCYGKRGRPSRH